MPLTLNGSIPFQVDNAMAAIGAAWAYKTWKDTEHEREFWAHCGMVRVYVGQPELQCVYKAPVTAAETFVAMVGILLLATALDLVWARLRARRAAAG